MYYNSAEIQNNLDGWIVLHWFLAFCCVAWYSMRLRHYFYRKTFWFELKEILRTLSFLRLLKSQLLHLQLGHSSVLMGINMGICINSSTCIKDPYEIHS
jgi:vacuolar-type H+-ATPase subunit I/STV1